MSSSSTAGASRILSRNNGKKLLAVRIIKHAMEIIHLLTDQNPIQVIVDAVINRPKPFHFAIVDEVDSVLIDEGRNPLLISGEASKDAARFPVAAKVAELLIQGIHYKVELKDNSVELTDEGIDLVEMALETNDLWDENDPWARTHFICPYYGDGHDYS